MARQFPKSRSTDLADISVPQMPLWTLILLIALAWLSYPIVGTIGLAAAIAEGTRPKDAGFSFMPELIVFPPLFLGVAVLIDYFAMPWGRWIVAALSIVMLICGFVVSLRNLIVMRGIKQAK
ncbi:hypothetical protein SH139x_004732 [Planctomycetaceae bacterium SH139]